MSIKKSYIEIVRFLEENQGKKVSSILPELLLMVESKKQANTYIKDSDDNVVAIFCWYHKQWELLADVEYGSKASNKATGLNTMCKVGNSAWTKKQRDAKKSEVALLDGISTGEINPGDIKNLMADIEANRLVIDTTNMPEGFATEEDVRTQL